MSNENYQYGNYSGTPNNYKNSDKSNHENFINQKSILNSNRRNNSIDSRLDKDKINYNQQNNYNKSPGTTDITSIITQLERNTQTPNTKVIRRDM